MTTGNVAREYRQAVEQAVFFDFSSRSKIELTGPEALMFLHNLCTQDVKNLPSGAGCEAFLTNAKARVIAHVFVGHYSKIMSPLPPGETATLSPLPSGEPANTSPLPSGETGRGEGDQDPHFILLDTVVGQAERILQHLDHFLISEQVEITDQTAALGQLHVCGAQAPAMLRAVIDVSLPSEQLANQAVTSLGERPIFVRRNDMLGLPGFDLFCPPDSIARIAAKLQEAGISAAGNETFEILRIEAGLPLFGPDIDDNRLAMEVGRPQAISYSKGCYLGQETIVMARDRGHVNRTLARLRIDGEKAAAPGSKIFHQDQEVGHITSSAVSPRFGPIALGYLRRGAQEPDKDLKLDDGRVVHVTPV